VVAAAARPLQELLQDRAGSSGQRLIFVGGKGGVGKTTTSSAMAVRLADTGLRTLIVSTDPAHSLSDALAQDLSGGRAVPVEGCPALLALEVRPDEAVARFRAAVGGFRASDLGLGGVAEEVLAQLGLDEFSDILDNTPPGLDELLALAETLALVRGGETGETGGDASLAAESFDRVVFDTAPTGHTLRLLAFPEFLDNLLGKLIALKARVAGALALLKGLLGNSVDPAAQLDAAVARLEGWQHRVAELQRLLTDADATDFVVVSVPSRLAVAESARLLGALAEQGVPVNHMVVNQLVAASAGPAYLGRLAAEQARALATLDAPGSALGSLAVSRVPFFDMEVSGVYALKYYADTALNSEAHAPSWAPFFEAEADRLLLVGGKGGVGKTTTSAAVAVECASRGFNTLVVSTDPAHSLGDALEVDLTDGKVARVQGLEGASLYAVEVQVDEAVQEFKRLVSGVAAGGGGGAAGAAGAAGALGLADFADIFDAVPPGVDELVALAKVVSLARADSYGVHFDRVIIDTAPTGHTLRLLTFPDFLDRFIDRLLLLRRRLRGATEVMGGVSTLLGGIGSVLSGKPVASGAGAAASEEPGSDSAGLQALTRFQAQMSELQALLRDPQSSEFAIVAIPTSLALSESARLLAALREQDIAVRRLVLNRLVAPDAGEAYLQRLAAGQAKCRDELHALARTAAVDLSEVGYFDRELIAVHGLRAMSAALFD